MSLPKNIRDREYNNFVEDTSGNVARRVIVSDQTATPQGVVSTANSSTSTLGVSASFTGTAEDVTDYASVVINAYSDTISEVNGFSLEFSPDGATWPQELKKQYTLLGGTAQSHPLTVNAQYFRVVYTNGDTAQSTFILQTIYHRTKQGIIQGTVERSFDRSEDAPNTRIVNDNEQDRNTGRIAFERTKLIVGSNPDVSTSYEVITDEGTGHVFSQNAEAVRVRSGGNINDDIAGSGARKIKIWGLDSGWNEVNEEVILAGASASASTTSAFRRVHYAEVTDVGTFGGSNTGDIIIENETANELLATIKANQGKTQSTVYTIPANKTGYITRLEVEADDNESAQIILYKREAANVLSAPYAPTQILYSSPSFTGQKNKEFNSYIELPQKTDIWVEAKTSGVGPGAVSASYDINIVDTDPALIFDNQKSCVFDGSNDYIDCGNDASLDVQEISISVWLNPTPTLNLMMGKWGPTAGQYAWYMQWNNGNIRFVVDKDGNGSGGNGRQHILTNALSTGTWYHFVVTYQNNDMRMYVNGVEAATTNVWAADVPIIPSTTSNVLLGKRSIGEGFTYEGYYDEVSLWNKALNATEVSEIFNRGVPDNIAEHSAVANCVSWWRMGDGDTYPTIADRIGSNDGTMTNMSAGSIVNVTP